jgi:hypothetical protein
MSIVSIPGAEPDGPIVTALMECLRSHEVPLLGARSHRFTFNGRAVNFATLVITNQRLLAAKASRFAKARPAISVELSAIGRTGSGPLSGVGPTWEAHFDTKDGSRGVVYFDGAIPAEAFIEGLGWAMATTSSAAE